MEAWTIALTWIAGGSFLYACYRVACWMSDDTAAESVASETRTDLIDATYKLRATTQADGDER